MQLESPFDAIHYSMLHAMNTNDKHYIHDFEVTMFAQTWGSTALGFGGIGGAAMTPAYTVILSRGNNYNVYFGGRHAYSINVHEISAEGRNKFFSDISAQCMQNLRGRTNYN